MRTKRSSIVCIYIAVVVIVSSLDVLARYRAIAAEKLQDKVKDVNLFVVECSKKRNHNAYVYGYEALFLLLVGHVIATVFGCWSYFKNLSRNWCSHACLIFMWVAFGAGVFFLKYGADPNKKSKLSCHLISHRGWLGYGGFLCLCHAICFAVFCGFGILAKGCLREDK
ncbi:unnamed protein product [Cuscuta europaea]|uniref:Uncharacterized protein n=1 Tax=Cuscuta europaea TaxID=41803 RepID=A0A9P1EHG0_CUSEU|nr:unnamed protein product [Cuscuta europaea]